MKITLERFDENFGFKARAGNHEMILDTAAEIGGNDQGFRPMLRFNRAVFDLTSKEVN